MTKKNPKDRAELEKLIKEGAITSEEKSEQRKKDLAALERAKKAHKEKNKGKKPYYVKTKIHGVNTWVERWK